MVFEPNGREAGSTPVCGPAVTARVNAAHEQLLLIYEHVGGKTFRKITSLASQGAAKDWRGHNSPEPRTLLFWCLHKNGEPNSGLPWLNSDVLLRGEPNQHRDCDYNTGVLLAADDLWGHLRDYDDLVTHISYSSNPRITPVENLPDGFGDSPEEVEIP